MTTKEKCLDPTMRMFSTVTVGAKGQIVIPKDVRELLSIKEWDSLMVITKHDIAIWLIKSDNLPAMMKYMQEEMER